MITLDINGMNDAEADCMDIESVSNKKVIYASPQMSIYEFKRLILGLPYIESKPFFFKFNISNQSTL